MRTKLMLTAALAAALAVSACNRNDADQAANTAAQANPGQTEPVNAGQDAVGAALSGAGVAHRIQTAGNLFSVFFTEAPVRTYDEAKAQDAFRFPPFFHAMLDAGVALPPSVFEAWFLSAAHDDAAMNRIVDALPAAARAAASATA